MGYFLAQVVLARRRGDDGEWMELLIFIVIAVIYALAGIMKKARDRKIDLGKEGPEEAKAAKPGRWQKAEGERAKAAQRHPLFRKLIIERPKEERPPVMPKRRAKPKPLEMPKMMPSVPALKVDMKEPEQEQLGLIGKKEEPGVAIEKLLDLEDSDDLRRAILHYEILGRPLSLRPQGYQT